MVEVEVDNDDFVWVYVCCDVLEYRCFGFRRDERHHVVGDDRCVEWGLIG